MEAEDTNADQSAGKTAKTETEDTFQFDFVRLQSFLPVEIWKLVAEKVEQDGNQVGIENLANSSPFFQNLLASQRTTHLFAKAFYLVASSVWKKEGLQGLPVSDILRCRAVCSKWNSVIDKLIREKFHRFETVPPDQKAIRIQRAFGSILGHHTWFDNFNQLQFFPRLLEIATRRTAPTKTVQDFLRHFELTHPANQPNGRNPLIWGDLSVSLCHRDNQNEATRLHFENISTVLSKYGSHITNFSFNFHGYQVYEWASIWQPWFTNMPNLKELQLCGVDIFPNENNFERDLNFAAIYPFPKFRQLEDVNVSGIPDQMFNQLILENDQISSISVLGLDGSHDFLTFCLPNLKDFDMDYKSVEIIEQMSSSQVVWPLERLALSYIHTDRSTRGGCGAAAVFQMIQDKFANTLVAFFFETEVMDISVDGPVYEDCKNFRLDLPKLKEISLFFSGSLICLDFLLPMKNRLEEISLRFGYKSRVMRDYKEKVQEECVVQFVGFEMDMLGSNIWRIFGKLKKIHLTRMKMTTHEGFQDRTQRTYTREQWMEKQ